jgi:hypothetical protein
MSPTKPITPARATDMAERRDAIQKSRRTAMGDTPIEREKSSPKDMISQ